MSTACIIFFISLFNVINGQTVAPPGKTPVPIPVPDYATYVEGPIDCGQTKTGTLNTDESVTYELTSNIRDPFITFIFNTCSSSSSLNPILFLWDYYHSSGQYVMGEIACDNTLLSSICTACKIPGSGEVWTVTSQYWNLGVNDQRWIELKANSGDGMYSLTMDCEYTKSPTTFTPSKTPTSNPTIITTIPTTTPTIAPTTSVPTTFEPTTAQPTTARPTTDEPSTVEPTTIFPTTLEPSMSPNTPIPNNEPTDPETSDVTTSKVETTKVDDAGKVNVDSDGGILNGDSMFLVIIAVLCFCLFIMFIFICISRRQKAKQNDVNKDVVHIKITTKTKTQTKSNGAEMIKTTVTTDGGNIDLRESSDEDKDNNAKKNDNNSTNELVRLASNESMYNNDHQGNDDNVVTTTNGMKTSRGNIQDGKDIDNVANDLLDDDSDESMYHNQNQTNRQLVTKHANDSDDEMYQEVPMTKTGGDM